MNFFEDVVKDIDKLEEDFLGPDYRYYKNVKNPNELGMSGEGSVGALARDIEGIIDYVEFLVSGSGPASRTGKPLGTKFFIKTGGQCKDYKTGKKVTRSMYINNVPTANIPIISNLTGMSFPEFRGIVPGVLEDIYSVNPLKMFRAFMEGNEPLCAEVQLETINADNIPSAQTGYIPIDELKDLQSDGKIPDVVNEEMIAALNKSNTKETFLNMCDNLRNIDINNSKIKNIKLPKQNRFSKFYYLAISLILVYIIYKIMNK